MPYPCHPHALQLFVSCFHNNEMNTAIAADQNPPPSRNHFRFDFPRYSEARSKTETWLKRERPDLFSFLYWLPLPQAVGSKNNQSTLISRPLPSLFPLFQLTIDSTFGPFLPVCPLSFSLLCTCSFLSTEGYQFIYFLDCSACYFNLILSLCDGWTKFRFPPNATFFPTATTSLMAFWEKWGGRISRKRRVFRCFLRNLAATYPLHPS